MEEQGAWVPEVGNFLGTATLIDAPGMADPVAWTLVFEVRFYLVVALLLLIDRRHMEWLPTNFWTMPFMIGFVPGAAAGLLIVKGMRRGAAVSLMVGAAWIVAGYSLVLLDGPLMEPYRAFLFAVPCALLLYGIATNECDGRLEITKSMSIICDVLYVICL